MAYARSEGAKAGYLLTTKRSRKDPKGDWKSVDLCCDRGGKYKKKQDVDCPFHVTGSRRRGLWYLCAKNNKHNHVSSKDFTKLQATRLPPVLVKLICDLTDAGHYPKYIMTQIRDKLPDIDVKPRTVYNVRTKHRWSQRQKLNSTQAPLEIS